VTQIYDLSAAPHFPQQLKSAVESMSKDGESFEGVEYGLDHELF
jgi:hypothetical protein